MIFGKNALKMAAGHGAYHNSFREFISGATN